MKIRNVLLMLVMNCFSFSFAESAHAEVIQYGKMREALAEAKSEARVELSQLTRKSHFYGVGAMEGLSGEIAIVDGETIVTQASSSKVLTPMSDTKIAKATYLVGSYVASWQTTMTSSSMMTKELEELIAQTATKNGFPSQDPFIFQLKGKVESADIHVIRGACPIHARLKKIELPESQKPFETKMKSRDVQIVGVFAKDRVGDLTHPATTIHAHIIYADPNGKKVNGHLESIVLAKGATLFIPKK